MKTVRPDTTASIYAFLNKLNDNILQMENFTAPLSETRGGDKVIFRKLDLLKLQLGIRTVNKS